MRKIGIIVAILLLIFGGLSIAFMVFFYDTSDKQDFTGVETYIEVEPEVDLEDVCNKKFRKDYLCEVGTWTSNSKDTALQLAILDAKGNMATSIQCDIERTSTNNSSESRRITGSDSEKITGIRQYFRTSENGNKMEDSEICIIPNIEGEVSIVKIKEASDFEEPSLYYVFVNGKLAGGCSYQKNIYQNDYGRKWEGESESYNIKLGEGMPDIQIKATRTVFDQEKNEYTVNVLVTLPKSLVSE